MEINKPHYKLHSQNGIYKSLQTINHKIFHCPHHFLTDSTVPPCSKFEAQAICDHHPLEPNFLSSVLALIFSIFCKRRTYIRFIQSFRLALNYICFREQNTYSTHSLSITSSVKLLSFEMILVTKTYSMECPFRRLNESFEFLEADDFTILQ